MPSSVGEWLIVIVALVVGLLGGWVLRGLRAAANPAAPIVEGDPVAGVAEVSAPATATVDQAHPEAVVDEVPPAAAVSDEPAPAGYDAPPAAATLAANATPLPSTDAEPAQQEEAADTTPVEVDADAASEPTEVESAPVEGREAPVVAAASTESDPEQPATVVAAEPEPAAAAVAEEGPDGGATQTVTVPAPRAALEDTLTVDAPEAPAEPAVVPVPVANGTAAVNGSAAEAADDFRRIQGVGPKMAAALQGAGIRTYQQLAELDEAALRETIKTAGLRATPALATWPQQAKLLAGAGAEAERVLPVGAGDQA